MISSHGQRDLGASYGPGVISTGPGTMNSQGCGGLHGHVRISPDGTVYVPKAASGCAMTPIPPSGEPNCIPLPVGDASWSGGYPNVGTANGSFQSLSSGILNGFVTNSLTGAKNMQLPFVQNSCTSNPPPCTDPIAIIRKPLVGELATGPLGSSRLYNKAQVRILLADTVRPSLDYSRLLAPSGEPALVQLYALARFDVLVLPTVPMTATVIPGPDAPREEVLARGLEMIANTCPTDVTGHPACSVPAGLSGGLPVGMMIVGKMFDDATVLRVAHAYERAVDGFPAPPGVGATAGQRV